MMKKLLALSTVLLSLAGESYSVHNVQPHLGLNRGQIAIGADYEYKFQENAGFGAYFLFASDDDSEGVPGGLAFGGNFKLHIDLTDVEVYAAPGFGFMNYELGNQDESFFGPSLKIGGLVNITPQVGVGLEYLNIFNWSSSDALVQDFNLALATVRIGF